MLVHKEYKDYIEFIHRSGGAGAEQLAPEAHLTTVRHLGTSQISLLPLHWQVQEHISDPLGY